MELYSFFNSSTSYRVRIALNLKGVPHDIIGVDIRTGVHKDRGFVAGGAANAGVPQLADGDVTLGQSLAIIDWLDARVPEPCLIPAEPLARARVLELAYLIACDIHPVNNLRVLKYLTGELGVSAEAKDQWYAHWIAEGMAGVERLLERHGGGPFCFGDTPTLADCCLIPQIANALRTGCDTAPYPRAMAIYAHAIEQPAFKAAMPVNQPDFS
jgi:maleylacetoacetate isomerase